MSAENSSKGRLPVGECDTATPYEAVLIFDGECPFCSAAAAALRRLPEVGVIAWNDDAAQRFLATQFNQPPFTLVFVAVTADEMWLGQAAAGELCDRAGLPTLVQDIVEDNFERIGDVVRGVAGAKRESADPDGTHSLNAAAVAEYQTLAANARRTHGTGDSRETAMEDIGYARL
jgi:predicted DCC family thiol-disulfide oxidoreductase YuxK